MSIPTLRLLPLALVAACAAEPPNASAPAAGPTVEPPAALAPYTERIPGTSVSFEMIPIPGGTFTMGSPATEPGRRDDEGPQRTIAISPFWIGKCEVTWDEYEQWMLDLERNRRASDALVTEADARADAITRPTPPYTDMTFGMGHDGFPAICMTHLAAATYCAWLSAKTGRRYRLPTEAEWEYACRAGTTTAYSFGGDATRLDDHAWHVRNAGDRYHRIGQKQPNPWGLHDMHGNVAEWVRDALAPYVAAPFGTVLRDPCVPQPAPYPHVVRGGSWQDLAPELRSAARLGSHPDWKMQDPQIPQSVWYHTDAAFVGFRVVCEP